MSRIAVPDSGARHGTWPRIGRLTCDATDARALVCLAPHQGCLQNKRPLLAGTPMIPALEALQRLKDGNRRYVEENRQSESLISPRRRAELTTRQEPFAAILGCSDSRVPVEIIFDQGLGDLFVIRVAGNIVAPSQVGSVEFVAERFKTRLVVVLGHSSCGVIQATLEHLQAPTERRSRNLHSIVSRVRPSVEGLLETGLRYDYDALVHHAVRANVRASADHLRHGSEIIEQLIQTEGLLVVGAEYSLETGLVEFFDGMPDDTLRQPRLDLSLPE